MLKQQLGDDMITLTSGRIASLRTGRRLSCCANQSDSRSQFAFLETFITLAQRPA